jgi:hypothetical protein
VSADGAHFVHEVKAGAAVRDEADASGTAVS